MISLSKQEICRERKTCRICGSSDLRPVIDLGEQHIAGQFIKEAVPERLQHRYPLELIRCASENSCGLVQLKHSVSPSVMYVDYGYHSGINQTMRNHLLDIAQKAQEMVNLNEGDTVVDIGCNDGTLLLAYGSASVDKIGFDPAESVARLARNKNLDVIYDYFSKNSFQQARPVSLAKIVTSIAMFYDLEDPCKFVRDVSSILTDDGVWVLELSYLPFMLQKNSFDTICHEHLEYYGLRQIEWMLVQENLKIHRIEFNEINGGSFRLFIRKKSFGPVPENDQSIITRVRAQEKSMGLDTERPYEAFRQAVFQIKSELKACSLNVNTRGSPYTSMELQRKAIQSWSFVKSIIRSLPRLRIATRSNGDDEL
jgi:NDP-4-keto-2,6-dideoxyhexose 3-C-methyltransferase